MAAVDMSPDEATRKLALGISSFDDDGMANDFVKEMLAQGADINARHPEMRSGSILHYCILQGYAAGMYALLTHGARFELPVEPDRKSRYVDELCRGAMAGRHLPLSQWIIDAGYIDELQRRCERNTPEQALIDSARALKAIVVMPSDSGPCPL